MNYYPYTGVGSRETPEDVLLVMFELGKYLGKLGFTLRSGHAKKKEGTGWSADTAFEYGSNEVNGRKEIYLPWQYFNHSVDGIVFEPTEKATQMAAYYHPAWDRCTDGVRKMHTRNIPQVLGINLDYPSLFLICWTSKGRGGGGTGQAIRIARDFNVPILDYGAYAVKDLGRITNEFFQHIRLFG
jgi:hypothetical protein